MDFKFSPTVTTLSIFLILVSGTLLRSINLENDPFWIDERGHISVALSSDLSTLFAGVREHAAAAPLDYLLLRFYQQITGAETRLELRLPYVFYGVLSLYLIYSLGRLIYNPSVGLLSAYALSISFFHIYYSQEVRFYSLSALIGLLSTITFLTALKRPGWSKWLQWGFICTVGFYTHYFLAFVFFIQFVWLIIVEIRREPNSKSTLMVRLTQPGVAFAGSILAFLPWFLWAANSALDNPPELGISFTQALITFMSALGPSLAFLVFSRFCVFSKKESWLLLSLAFIPFFGVYLADNFAAYFFNARQLIFTLPFSIILGSASLVLFSSAVLRALEKQNKAYLKPILLTTGGSLMFVFTLANALQVWKYFK